MRSVFGPLRISPLAIAAIFAGAAWAQPACGPAAGSVLAVGGGAVGPEIADEFIRLAGGLDAPVVVIPTAGDAAAYEPAYLQSTFLWQRGMRRLTLLHTRDRAVADSEEFTAPLRAARGAWIEGGRQWRLVDAYLGARTEQELHALLARGGVVGGSSAGATILGSYLVRGDPEGNRIMMAKGYEQGFGFLRGVAIDQHLLARRRERDMLAVIRRHPALLGIGLDESTAILVEGDRFRVVGPSKVAIYDSRYTPGADGLPYYFLSAGDAFDLAARSIVKEIGK
jgi:cyanophycinase